MRRFGGAGLVCATCVALGALPAPADFYDGLEAYDRGDYAGAYREWLGPAGSGDASAQVNLGALYWRGQGVEQDHARAADWFRKAAEQGNAIAQDNLGQMYYLGQGVEQSNAQAARWIRAAAEQGDASAQLRLGSLYSEGIGVERDLRVAADWWRRSAEQGNAEAGIRLGLAYERGSGVPVDHEQAEIWFERAAEARAERTPGLSRGSTPADVPAAALDPSGTAQGAASPTAAMIQIAAVSSPDAAIREWERLQQSHPDLLDSLTLNVERVDLGERGIFYRVRAGPLRDRKAASALCEQLESRALDCLVSPDP